MPVLDHLSLSLLQIESLVTHAGKKTHKTSFLEVNQILEQRRPLTESHLIRCLFSSIDFSPYETRTSQKDVYQANYLCQELNSVLSKPNFISLLCHAIDCPMPSVKGFGPYQNLLQQFSRVLKLNAIQDVLIGLVLINSNNAQLAYYAQQRVRQKLPDLIRSSVPEKDTSSSINDGTEGTTGGGESATLDLQSTVAGPFQEVGIELLHFIVRQLCEVADHFGLSNRMLQSFIRLLQRAFPRSQVPLVLSALLYPDIVEMNSAKAFCHKPSLIHLINLASTSKVCPTDMTILLSLDHQQHTANNLSAPDNHQKMMFVPTSISSAHLDDLSPDSNMIADLLEELGPSCTKSLDTMRLTLAEFQKREVSAAAVAKCLCLFMRTAAGRGDPESAQIDEEEALLVLRVSGSGALWREASDVGSTLAGGSTGDRPTSMILPRDIGEEKLRTCSSEPRLGMSSHSSAFENVTCASRWNLEHFLTVVFELNPSLSFDQILNDLDCPEFVVCSREAFQILKQFLLRGPQCQLPVNFFYHPWTHIYGQFSLLRACWLYPEVICLAYWSYRCVDLSAYRLNPTDEQAKAQIWKNVDYVEALLNLSERGLFSLVYNLLCQAFALCPSILTATLFETSACTTRSTVLSHSFVYFLTPRNNSQVVLQSAWYGLKVNCLSSEDLQQQRPLLLAAILECMSQLMNGVLEPSTLPDCIASPTTSGSTGTQQSNLTRLVESVAGITDHRSSITGNEAVTKTLPPLTYLLGTSNAPSAAVAVLFPTSGNQGLTVGSPQLLSARHLLPTPMQAIDLALVLFLRIANAVNLAISRAQADGSSSGSTTSSSSVNSIHNAISVFPVHWFSEYLRDKELAEPFIQGLVKYLAVRYGPHMLGSAMALPDSPTSAAVIVALPNELRKPSVHLLTRIIQSAQAALNSPTCCLRASVLNEVSQTLNLYLQNLSVLSTGSASSATTGANQGARPLAPSLPLGDPSMKPTTAGGVVASVSGSVPQQRVALASTGLHPAYPSSSELQNTAVDESYLRGGPGAHSFPSRLNQAGLLQHGALSISNQRKSVDNTSSGHGGLTSDYQPIALSFSNEPIKVELPKEVEAEAHSFFKKLLGRMNSPDEMFKTVCDYATQGNPVHRKRLDGILRMLADELGQYLQDYPEPLLPLIADLYGNILAASTQILSVRVLSMLWRALLTRLHSTTAENVETPAFRALILILVKAKHAFIQFINLPGYLVSCPVFTSFPPELQDYILAAELLVKNYLRSLGNTTVSASKSATSVPGFHQPGQLLGQHQTSTTVGSSNQLLSGLCLYSNQLTESPYQPPDAPEESVSDRIYFLFNNVSPSNAKEKSSELAELLTEDRLLPWFTFYLISKRVPVEHTFHDLFALVLDQIQERVPNLRAQIMEELLRNIKILLRTMRKDRDDMQSRTTLKHLGNFLGLITLARNKPLLHDDLNVKDLIYEAYHKGTTSSQYVVPFVARIVQSATQSLVFKPPNPWTMGILKVFRELYDLEDVKDCLRFEIELLYRKFTLNVEDVPMAHFLRDRLHVGNLEIQLCFFVPMETTSATVDATSSTPTISSTNTPTITSAIGGSSTAMVDLSSTTSMAPPTALNQQQQQHINNVLAAIQKQQQQQQSSAGTDLQTVQNAQTMYPANANVDLMALMQSSAGGVSMTTGGNAGNTRAIMFAAAFAASQQQKQQSSTAPHAITGSASSAPFSSSVQQQQHQHQQQQQKQQWVAALAALQQMQQQHQPQSTTTALTSYNSSSQAMLPLSHATLPPITSDSSVDIPRGSLRYEDVNIRSIRACLNIDELLATAARTSNQIGNNGSTASINQAAITLLQSNPRLRSLIEPAITRAIGELTTPVFERCARITVTTVAAIIRKDFALDPDSHRMLYAARQMVKHLAAGMSLITAREALGMSLVTSLKNIILAEIQSASAQEKEAVQRLAHIVVAKSMHICLAFMQKSVAEKAVGDVEKKLEPDAKLRSELGSRRFLEQASARLSTQQTNLPESLRLTIGGPSATEMTVYDEFGRVIPGFAPSTVTSAPTAGSQQQTATNSVTPAQVAYLQQQQQQQQQQQHPDANRMQRTAGGPAGSLLKPLLNQTSQQQLMMQQQSQTPVTTNLDKIISQSERHLAFISSRLCSVTDPMICSLKRLIDMLHLAKTNRDANAAATVITAMVQSFLEHYRPSVWRNQPRGLETMEHLKEAHMLTLRHMLSSDQASFGYAWVTRQVTQTWIQLDGGPPTKDRAPSKKSSVDSTSSVDASSTGKILTKDEKTSKDDMNMDNAWSNWKSVQSEGLGANDSVICAVKWNWEAFAELLKVHVIYLSQVDTYLAQEVASGHPGAITFVIDLLDNFVLPSPNGTVVGAAAAAARMNTLPGAPSQIGNAQGGPSGNTSVPTAGQPTSGPPATKREFTVLNEYDLWSTLEALRARVTPQRDGSHSLTAMTDPLVLRIRIACTRIRGLLDLGLLEQSPLFVPTANATSITPISALYAGCSQAREFDDPPNLQEKVELLMRNWMEVYQSPQQRDPATIEALLVQLAQIGVMPNMDNLTRFLRLATIFVIERALKRLKLHDQQPQMQQQNPEGMVNSGGMSQLPPLSGNNSNTSMARVAAYIELDAYARLISIIIQRSGEHSSTPTTIKVTLLNKVLGIIAGTLLQEHEVRREWFHPMPFARILIMLFVELHSPASPLLPNADTVDSSGQLIDSTMTATDNNRGLLANLTLQQQLPLIFSHLLHCLRPEKATAFIFSWLEMLAHRWFVGRTLAAPCPTPLRSVYQAMYAQLLVDLLKFLGYFLQNALMPKPIQCLYKATLRLLLVLIHDFPEFVSDYYALFCDVVPSNSIQMRNLILSALPKRGIPASDPLQAPPVDNLASLEDPNGYCMQAGSRLPEPMRHEVDTYLASRAPVKLLSELVTMLRRADEISPPLPLLQFSHHPQQQVRNQQALAAYAAVLSTGETISLPASKTDQLTSQPSSDQAAKTLTEGASTSEPLQTTTEGGATMDGSGVSAEASRSSTSSSVSSAAAAALLWSVRTTQQLATFGLTDQMHYNVELMTNLMLYVCITAIRNLREKGMPLNMSTIAHTPQMDIIQSLVLNLDNEGRYLLLNCMANQLRYPNSHTYYFSYTILYLFSEQSKEQVKEQISRVLMERLIVNRPHPWGLLMTSAELLRNPAYRFWEHEFARCNPEIETLVTIVARSCIPHFQIPTLSSAPPSASSVTNAPSTGLRTSLAAVTGDRRRQTSPLTRASPTDTTTAGGGTGGIRMPRSLNTFISG